MNICLYIPTPLVSSKYIVLLSPFFCPLPSPHFFHLFLTPGKVSADRLAAYSRLFSLLQNRPYYVALLARRVTAAHMDGLCVRACVRVCVCVCVCVCVFIYICVASFLIFQFQSLSSYGCLLFLFHGDQSLAMSLLQDKTAHSTLYAPHFLLRFSLHGDECSVRLWGFICRASPLGSLWGKGVVVASKAQE